MIDKIQKLLSQSSPIIKATNAKEASVLLTLVTVKDTLSLLYTLRSPALQRNSGQVSFPGGMKDPADNDYEATALRETDEEIGISNVIIIGRLDPVLDRTLTIRVHPIVGFVDGSIIPKDLKCNPSEVSSVFSVGLEDLISTRNNQIQNFNSPFKISIPSWNIKANEFGIGTVSLGNADYTIWGLTAYITDQFLRLLDPKTLKLEKAQSMLYRFREIQLKEAGLPTVSSRPREATTVMSVRACERYRANVIKELDSKISRIQDSSLQESAIRDLNDEINKLLKEKGHWEWQIKELGGNIADDISLDLTNGKEAPGTTKGYKYFGRAKELPGVKELFEQHEEEKKDYISKLELASRIDPDYFGYRDEEDGRLLAFEKSREMIALQNLGLGSVPNLPIQDYPMKNIPSLQEVEGMVVAEKAAFLRKKYNLV